MTQSESFYKKTSVQLITVGHEVDGQRLDNFLLRQLKGVPKTRIYRILRKGEVRVNGGRCKPSRRLVTGDQVRIPPIRTAEAKEAPKLSPSHSSLFEAAIIYEDSHLLIFNKPAGMAVHSGSGVKFGVIESLRNLRPDLSSLELAHRLDRDTSGVLALAKGRKALAELLTAMADHSAEKRYRCLISGHLPTRKCRVDVNLRKNQLQRGERLVVVDDQGKTAITDFEEIEKFQEVSLVDAILLTGRTHQIRVHAQHLGMPILGDSRYQNSHALAIQQRLKLGRMCLHAATLTLPLLNLGGSQQWSAPLPPELSQCVDQLRAQAHV